MLTQINFTHRHFEHKTEQIYLKMSFRLEKHAETFISPVSIVSKAIRCMLCQFHNPGLMKAIPYIIYAETMHDKLKQTPFPIWFLRRCDSKSPNGNKV